MLAEPKEPRQKETCKVYCAIRVPPNLRDSQQERKRLNVRLRPHHEMAELSPAPIPLHAALPMHRVHQADSLQYTSLFSALLHSLHLPLPCLTTRLLLTDPADQPNSVDLTASYRRSLEIRSSRVAG